MKKSFKKLAVFAIVAMQFMQFFTYSIPTVSAAEATPETIGISPVEEASAPAEEVEAPAEEADESENAEEQATDESDADEDATDKSSELEDADENTTDQDAESDDAGQTENTGGTDDTDESENADQSEGTGSVEPSTPEKLEETEPIPETGTGSSIEEPTSENGTGSSIEEPASDEEDTSNEEEANEKTINPTSPSEQEDEDNGEKFQKMSFSTFGDDLFFSTQDVEMPDLSGYNEYELAENSYCTLSEDAKSVYADLSPDDDTYGYLMNVTDKATDTATSYLYYGGIEKTLSYYCPFGIDNGEKCEIQEENDAIKTDYLCAGEVINGTCYTCGTTIGGVTIGGTLNETSKECEYVGTTDPITYSPYYGSCYLGGKKIDGTCYQCILSNLNTSTFQCESDSSYAAPQSDPCLNLGTDLDNSCYACALGELDETNKTCTIDTETERTPKYEYEIFPLNPNTTTLPDITYTNEDGYDIKYYPLSLNNLSLVGDLVANAIVDASIPTNSWEALGNLSIPAVVQTWINTLSTTELTCGLNAELPEQVESCDLSVLMDLVANGIDLSAFDGLDDNLAVITELTDLVGQIQAGDTEDLDLEDLQATLESIQLPDLSAIVVTMNSLANTLDELDNCISLLGMDIDDTVDYLRETATAIENLDDAIEGVEEEINALFEEGKTASEYIQAFSNLAGNIKDMIEALDDVTESLDTLQQNIDGIELLESLSSPIGDVVDLLNTILTPAKGILEQLGDIAEFTDKLADLVENIENEDLDGAIQSLDALTETDLFSTFQQKVIALTNELNATFEDIDSLAGLAAQLPELTLEGDCATNLSDYQTEVSEYLTNLISIYGELADHIDEIAAITSLDLSEAQDGLDSIIDNLETLKSEIDDINATTICNDIENTETRIEDIQSQLTTELTAIQASTETLLAILNGEVDMSIDQLDELLEFLPEQIKTEIESYINELWTLVQEKALNFTQELSNTFDDIDNLADVVAQLPELSIDEDCATDLAQYKTDVITYLDNLSIIYNELINHIDQIEELSSLDLSEAQNGLDTIISNLATLKEYVNAIDTDEACNDAEDIQANIEAQLTAIQAEIENQLAEIQTNTDELLTSLDGKIDTIKAELDELLELIPEQIRTEIENYINDLWTLVQEKLTNLYDEATDAFNKAKLDAPVLASPYIVNQDTATFGMSDGNDEALGYVAIVTDSEGNQSLYFLAGNDEVDFILPTSLQGEYSVNIRAIGKDDTINTDEIYNFLAQIDVTDNWASLIQSITALRDTAENEANNARDELPESLRLFVAEIISTTDQDTKDQILDILSKIEDGVNASYDIVAEIQAALDEANGTRGVWTEMTDLENISVADMIDGLAQRDALTQDSETPALVLALINPSADYNVYRTLTPTADDVVVDEKVNGDPKYTLGMEMHGNNLEDADEVMYKIGGNIVSQSYSTTFDLGTTNGTYTVCKMVDKYEQEMEFCSADATWEMNVEDTTAPKITIGEYSTARTNGNIEVTAETDEGKLNTGSHTFKTNGSFDFVATDFANNITTETVEITNIDKTAPVCGTWTYSPTASTNGNVVATLADSTDKDSGINTAGGTCTITENNTSCSITISDNAGNEISCSSDTITNIDRTAPTATITYDVEAPTSGNVVATVILDEEGIITNNDGSNTYTFTETGSFTFEFQDEAGNTGEKTATVNNIDKVAPIINFGDYPTGRVNHNFTIYAGTNEGTLNTESHFFTENESFDFVATDDAGNVTTVTITIDKFDKTKPTGNVAYDIETPTSGNVLATLNLNEDINEITITNNDGSNEYLFTENDEFTFEFVDEAGNTGEATATVNNIDKIDPKGTITYAIKTPTSGNVLTTITLNETGTITNNDGSDTYLFTGNGTYTFEFIDEAGNTGEKTAIVNNIDKINPTLTGITNGATYTTNATFTATDNVEVARVVLDGTGLESRTEYTLSTIGEHSLSVYDTANNVTTIAFTIKKKTSGGGGGSSADYCPDGDYSPSYYDNTCGEIEVVEITSSGEVENNLIIDNGYSDEFNQAYNFAKEYGITDMTSIQEANMEGNVTRSELSKMLVRYNINVLGKTIDTGIVCEFTDIDTLSPEMQAYAILSCQLGLMGMNTNGKFMPQETVTRAQFGTILSRLLYNTPNVGTPYYLVHFNVLKALGIITDTNPNLIETRAYIMIMLMNASK